ncbi:uncharacterized protein LOC114769573 [Denticeps clupeoides]|nr:uncharacterized protein LOC114769573 [Denticeps clupeoides]XP_028818557.1 uncharacterized protein LOC114769573 [Denticeps clupeoides]
MNWDNQLSSALSAADGSVAKMRTHLATPGRPWKGREDLHPVRDTPHAAELDPPLALSPKVQWSDLTAIQTQLQNQNQVIDSLTQSLRSSERDRQSHQRQIQALQEEVQRLRGQAEDSGGRAVSPTPDWRLEQWKREISREVDSLRAQVNRAVSLGDLEESFSSKLRREELEQLRREMDQLKSKMMRHEEDLFQQQSEARETRRQYERSCKTLESLTDNYRTHTFELSRTIAQYQHTQQEVRDIRVTVSQLKDEVRGLILCDRRTTPAAAEQKPEAAAAVAMATSPQRRVVVPGLDSEEDLSPTPSLGDVSSDDLDLSWLPDRKSAHPQGGSRLTGSDISDSGSGLDSNHDDGGDSPAELSLSDL